MSEGAGCIILENLENVKNRNAESKIYAEILGTGLNSDVNHITNPSPDGDGAYR
jgi:3-oxoacyl-[acyl-carrier-protein] synthase II